MRAPGERAPRPTRAVAAALVGAVTLLLTACGISADASPQIISKKDVPYGLLSPSPSTTSVTAPSEYVTIYLDGPERLVDVSRAVPAPGSLGNALQALGQGPTTAEAAQGLVSPISTAAPLKLSRIGGGSVTVSVSAGFTNLGGEDQIVAVAQLVYTVTAFPGIDQVSLRIDGRAVLAPTGNGHLSRGPLSRNDYSSLSPI